MSLLTYLRSLLHLVILSCLSCRSCPCRINTLLFACVSLFLFASFYIAFYYVHGTAGEHHPRGNLPHLQYGQGLPLPRSLGTHGHPHLATMVMSLARTIGWASSASHSMLYTLIEPTPPPPRTVRRLQPPEPWGSPTQLETWDVPTNWSPPVAPSKAFSGRRIEFPHLHSASIWEYPHIGIQKDTYQSALEYPLAMLLAGSQRACSIYSLTAASSHGGTSPAALGGIRCCVPPALIEQLLTFASGTPGDCPPHSHPPPRVGQFWLEAPPRSGVAYTTSTLSHRPSVHTTSSAVGQAGMGPSGAQRYTSGNGSPPPADSRPSLRLPSHHYLVYVPRWHQDICPPPRTFRRPSPQPPGPLPPLDGLR